jgi:hypothetical protein
VFSEVEPEVLQQLEIEAGVSLSKQLSAHSIRPTTPIDEADNEDTDGDDGGSSEDDIGCSVSVTGGDRYQDNDYDKYTFEYANEIETSRRSSITSTWSGLSDLGSRRIHASSSGSNGSSSHGSSGSDMGSRIIAAGSRSGSGGPRLTVRVDSQLSLGDSDCSLASVSSAGSDGGFSPRSSAGLSHASSSHSLIHVNSSSNLDEILKLR